MTATMSDAQLSLLSIKDGQVTWSKEQTLALIDVLRVRHASEADLAVFFHLCRQRQLDPFLRQIYMIARNEWDKEAQAKVWRQTFQTGIDGFRTVASRRAARLGVTRSYEPTVYYDSEGVGHEVWVKDGPPAAIKVTVLLGGEPFPFTAKYTDYVPLVDEYEPDVWVDNKKTKGKKTGNRVPSGMWAVRPTGQLEKCAEAAALRRACPEDLGGIYEFAEMERDQADQPITTLVDDGAAKAKHHHHGGTNWLYKIRRAKSRKELSLIYRQAKDAGEKTSEIDKAISERAAKLPPEDPSPDQGQAVPDSGTGEPSAEDLPFVMQERLIAAGVTTEEAARALSVDERDRILGVAAWGGEEDQAFEWAVSHIDQPHGEEPS